ncbi:hypothetical protein [Vibrio rotiferianus]|uniref:hypothetical protein n=1 Tax=Vibrio rotiferianus TaxID=190895 RepID=UPI00406A28D0
MNFKIEKLIKSKVKTWGVNNKRREGYIVDVLDKNFCLRKAGTLESLCNKYGYRYSPAYHKRLCALNVLYRVGWDSNQPVYCLTEQYEYLGVVEKSDRHNVILFYLDMFEKVKSLLCLKLKNDSCD